MCLASGSGQEILSHSEQREQRQEGSNRASNRVSRVARGSRVEDSMAAGESV